MEELISKAAMLLEALPYIQRFRSQTFVVKYGGSFMDSPDPEVRNGVARDIVFLEAVGINPVVVHGGGKAITRAMEAAGLKANFIQGQRVTDEATVKVVDQVLSREINPEIVKTINASAARRRFRRHGHFHVPQASGSTGHGGRETRHRLRRRSHRREHRAVARVHSARHHAGHQPDGARRGWPDLQLQRRRRRRAGRHRAQGEAAGFHERRAGSDARSERSGHGHRRICKRAKWTELKKAGIVDKGMIPKVDSAVAAIRSRRGKGFLRGRPRAALGAAGNFHRRRRRHGGGCSMREIVPEPPAIVRNDVAAIQELFAKHVVPTYGRFDLGVQPRRGQLCL